MKSLSHYNQIADLFRYPDENFTHTAKSILESMRNLMPELSSELGDFIKAIEGSDTLSQQEYFMKTFDVNAVCYLDLGYVMFGEDYKRAQLLVNLQKEHVVANVDCGKELADHLPNVLCLLSKTKNPEFVEELGYIITMPAVRFMITKFKNSDNYYKILLEVLLQMLLNDFKGENMKEFAFAEEKFNGKNEFLMPSPKMTICNSKCKQKRF
jgi:nitrate reductase assembly molybdenum cofactor insertion protein NarJ